MENKACMGQMGQESHKEMYVYLWRALYNQVGHFTKNRNWCRFHDIKIKNNNMKNTISCYSVSS